MSERCAMLPLRSADRRRRSHIRAGSSRERGAALVEAAFVIPFLLVLVLGVVDYGFMINRGTLLNNATREGAREGMFGSDAATIEARIRDAAGALDQADLSVTVTCKSADGTPCPGVSFDSEWEPGGSVIVETQYTYHYITPIAPMIGFGPSHQLKSDIEMRIEG